MTEVLLCILVVMNLAWIIVNWIKDNRKEVHGYIVAFDDGNMYLELIDKDSIDKIHNSEYVTFKVIKTKDTRE